MAIVSAAGVGYIVIVNVFGTPGQLLAEGVTVIVSIIILLPVFTAVNEGILSAPLAPRPIEVFGFVHVNVVPAVVLVNVTLGVEVPLHTATGVIVFTFGAGFTIILKVTGTPEQPLAIGVTVMRAVSGATPVFTAVKEVMSPVPLAARPIEGSELVHWKVLPATGPVKVTVLVEELVHTVCDGTVSATGKGYTLIVKV